MKIMSLVNKAELAFQLSVSGLLAYCSSFTSAPFCSTGSELRYWLGAHPVWGNPDNFAGNTAWNSFATHHQYLTAHCHQVRVGENTTSKSKAA